jgi:hypothetical protein
MAGGALGGGYMLYDALSGDKSGAEKSADVGGALGNIGDVLGRFAGQQFAGGAGPAGGGSMTRSAARGGGANQKGASWADRIDRANEWYGRGSTAVDNASSVMDALGISIDWGGKKDGQDGGGSDQAPSMTFSPSLQITVNGDVKNPAQLAGELMPHLKTLFAQMQSAAAPGGGAGMYDGAHV